MKKILGLVSCALVTSSFPAIISAELPSNNDFSTEPLSEIFQQETLQERMNSSESAAAAALIVYNNRADFEAAVPGILTENFENALVEPGGIVACDNPLVPTEPNFCFPPGGLLDGFIFEATGGPLFDDIVVLGGSNPLGNRIAPNHGLSSTILRFPDPGVFAVGFQLDDVFSDPVPITVLSANGRELEITISSTAFFGVTSDTPLTTIRVGNGRRGPLMDSLSFGAGCPCIAENSLFSDVVNGLVPVVNLLQCRDEEDGTGVLMVRPNGSIVGAASGTRGGRPNMCGTKVNNREANFIAISPEEDATCRAHLRAACPE